MGSNKDISTRISIDELPFLNEEHVHIKDKKSLIVKLNNMVHKGKDQLQVITDYDLTITKQHLNGERTPSSFGLLCFCKHLPDGFIETDKELMRKYYPIERDPNMSVSEKLPHMLEWYRESQQMFSGLCFDYEELRTVIRERGPSLRDGSVEMFKLLEKEKVPVLVLSAGLGNVVLEVLKHHNLTENEYFHIISNFLQIENGQVKGFGCQENGMFIHSLNKNGLGCSSYFERLGSSRSNVIILGDSLGDGNMDQGVPLTETVLKIGFLYGTKSHVEESLPAYEKVFDIVLIDDQTVKIPRAIIDLILGV